MPAKSLSVALRAHAANVDRLLACRATVPQIAAVLHIEEGDVRTIIDSTTNKSAQIRGELADGPKTSREVADALGYPLRVTSALIGLLLRRRHARVIGQGPRFAGDDTDLLRVPIYALTDKGRARMQAKGELA